MTNAELATLCAASYDPTPPGNVIDRPGGLRAVFSPTGDVLTIRGTDCWENVIEDVNIVDAYCRAHPQLGECCAGALDAAEALFPLVRKLVRPGVIVTGHSLGGQIASPLAALLMLDAVHVGGLVAFDPPKPGGARLRDVVGSLAPRVYRFRCSPVTEWPLMRFEHVAPEQEIGDWTWSPLRAHSISRAARWLVVHP